MTRLSLKGSVRVCAEEQVCKYKRTPLLSNHNLWQNQSLDQPKDLSKKKVEKTTSRFIVLLVNRKTYERY